jgi:hypothetical protein
MKNSLFTLIFCFFFTAVVGQSLQIVNPVKIVSGNASEPLLAIGLTIKNISQSEKSVKVERTVISELTGSENNMCWGVECYSPMVDETPGAQNIAAGATNSTFKADYYHYGNLGISKLKYCFFVDGNKVDSVCQVIEFSAYQINNGSLEAWTNSAGIESPDDYVTSNSTLYSSAQNVFKSTESVSGFASKLESVILSQNPSPENIPDTAAFMLYGSFGSSGELKGLPFAGQPRALFFQTKYLPAGTDTFSVVVQLTKWTNNSRVVLARGEFRNSQSHSQYIDNELILEYANTDMLSDSIIILVTSSGKVLPQLGSQLHIDEISPSESIPTSIKRISLAPKNNLKVFPNPANDKIFFSSEQHLSRLYVIDFSGNLVSAIDVNASNNQNVELDVSHLSPGIYFYKTIGETPSYGKFLINR